MVPIWKALGMASTASAYPKGACREAETGNTAEHADDCAGWAASGECVKSSGPAIEPERPCVGAPAELAL